MNAARTAAGALVFLVCALAITLGVAITLFGIPVAELPAIGLLLVCVGGGGGLLAVLILHPGVQGRLGGMRGQLVVANLAISLVLLGMLLAGAQAMFFSQHDLALLLTLLLFAALLAVGFSLLWATPLARRIERVRAGTAQLAGGDLQTSLQIAGSDEIAQLAADFNRMAAALRQAAANERELEQARRDLIAAVSHDLRTPLAATRALVEALVDGVVEDPQTEARYLQSIQREVEHLSRLVDDLFELAQIDAGLLRLNLERASLHDLLSDTLASFQPQAQQQGVRLIGEVAGDIDPVLASPPKLQRVLHNLLSNALRHTPSDGTIWVRAVPCGNMVQVEVADTGEGIPVDDLSHVFERSFRGERSRTRQGVEGTPGAGLGLAIARGLIEAHGGTIAVENRTGRGACFRFTLKRA